MHDDMCVISIPASSGFSLIAFQRTVVNIITNDAFQPQQGQMTIWGGADDNKSCMESLNRKKRLEN